MFLRISFILVIKRVTGRCAVCFEYLINIIWRFWRFGGGLQRFEINFVTGLTCVIPRGYIGNARRWFLLLEKWRIAFSRNHRFIYKWVVLWRFVFGLRYDILLTIFVSYYEMYEVSLTWLNVRHCDVFERRFSVFTLILFVLTKECYHFLVVQSVLSFFVGCWSKGWQFESFVSTFVFHTRSNLVLWRSFSFTASTGVDSFNVRL